jgi:(heptosyl)LPS beta-1,4-glucosyltransferase
MRLGGFVIHGDNAAGIAPCLDSLAAVCDDLVAVGSGPCEATAALAAARGFRTIRRPWEGYGAARVEAARALSGCDWLLFLDTDEWFGPEALDAIRSFKAAPPDVPYGKLPRRDWAEFGGRRFLYRTEHHVRLVRRDHAAWDRSMIVHEALPDGPGARVDAVIEHLFATSVEGMREKNDRYALLWALRYGLLGRRSKWPPAQRAHHLVREFLLKGALFSRHPEAWGLAAVIAGYHARKYTLLREVAAGGHEELLALLREDRLEELFRRVSGIADVLAAESARQPGEAAPLPQRAMVPQAGAGVELAVATPPPPRPASARAGSRARSASSAA